MTSLADRALIWFSSAARDLPWRRPSTTPWGVLVSEVMLQQTPVARVAPVWLDWLARWPTAPDLAADSPGEAIRAWGRLGYPRRALRLHACAQAITDHHGGDVPDELDQLLALPGVGAYTARAVAAFGYGQRHPVVDTNVRRLVARVVAGRPDGGPVTTAADLAAVETLLPRRPDRAARASAALMELGAVLCTARAPRCTSCPLVRRCAWHRAGQPGAHGRTSRPQAYAGTDRQARGVLLGLARQVAAPVPRSALEASWPDDVQCERALRSLLADGLLVELDGAHFALPGPSTAPTSLARGRL